MNDINLCILKESLCIGGTERSVANISKILQNDYNLFLCLYNGKDIKYSYGGELIDIKVPPKKTKILKIINSLIRSSKVKEVLKENNINIVYEFLSITNFLSFVKYRNIIKLISARDFGIMQRKTFLYHYALKKSDGMICNSEYIKNYYLNRYPKDRNKVFVVYNVIDLEQINRQAEETIDEEFQTFLLNHSKTIVSTGRFCKEKGFEYLLESFALTKKQINSVGLVLIGDGSYKEKYKLIIQKLNLQEDVFFTGFQTNPYKYMKRCQCYVLSSLSEGFPNVLTEAMALGLPVISTNCFSGPAEILREDKKYLDIDDSFLECDYGILTPRINEENCVNAINQISRATIKLLKNQDLMLKYSKLAKLRAGFFSKELALGKYKLIFNDLLMKK